MARRYVTSVLGIADEDIAIRHLERGVKFVLEHLNEKAITFRQPFTNNNDNNDEEQLTHRRFIYNHKDLSKYEQSDDFSNLLNELSTQRMLKDLLRLVLLHLKKDSLNFNQLQKEFCMLHFVHLTEIQLIHLDSNQ